MSDEENKAAGEGEELSLADKLKRELDELRVQIHLGKAEAEDYVEKHKEQFSGFLGKVREKVEEGEELGAEKANAVRQKVDELRVQLALGKMESRDVYEEQKEKIGGAVGELQKELEPLGERAEGVWNSLKTQYEEGAEALKTKMDVLGLQLGLAKEELGQELKLKRDQVDEELRDLSIQLGEMGGTAKEKMAEVGEEISGAFKSLRERLKDLF